MADLKGLAKDTAIYGLSSIVGRFLNYLLVPLYTAKLSAASGGYGVITNVYAYTALLFVILTYGMETTFFRYSNKEGEDPRRVYSTILMSVGFTSMVFVLLVLAFISPISSAMGYADHPSYIWTMALTVALDAFQAIPFAYLRYKKRPIKFAALKMLFIIMNICLNLVFFVLLPALYESSGGEGFISKIYDPTVGVGYAFYINLFCTGSITFLFWKELTGFKYVFDRALLKRMLGYSWPILVLGIAGILNQTADKIIFPYVYKGADAHAQLGIYGAASKIAMIMAMITQAFRYAYEPFVFNKSRDADSRQTYAAAMKYFIIFTLLAFLVVVAYLPIFRYIIAPDYWGGLKVTPIVMVAGILLGIFYNLSLWYKLVDKTIYGMWFSFAGCAVLIAVNVIFIPRYSYMACAWGGVAGYGVATLLSYFVGQKYYPINYPLKSIGVYVLLAALFYTAMSFVPASWPMAARLLVNTVCVTLFAAHAVHYDFPLSNLPVVGKYFRKK